MKKNINSSDFSTKLSSEENANVIAVVELFSHLYVALATMPKIMAQKSG